MIINTITPGTMERKLEELRKYLFPGLKFRGEPDYDPKIHPLLTDERLKEEDEKLKYLWEAEYLLKEADNKEP